MMAALRMSRRTKYPFTFFSMFHEEMTAISITTTDSETKGKLRPSSPTKYSAFKIPQDPRSSVIQFCFSTNCNPDDGMYCKRILIKKISWVILASKATTRNMRGDAAGKKRPTNAASSGVKIKNEIRYCCIEVLLYT